jgi:hypothetical protein
LEGESLLEVRAAGVAAAFTRDGSGRDIGMSEVGAGQSERPADG